MASIIAKYVFENSSTLAVRIVFPLVYLLSNCFCKFEGQGYCTFSCSSFVFVFTMINAELDDCKYCSCLPYYLRFDKARFLLVHL